MGITGMTDKLLNSQAFKLKGRLYTLTVLSILEPTPALFSEQLADAVAQAPRLLKQTPVVLDCAEVNAAALDLKHLCDIIRIHELVPVAVQGGDARLESLAKFHGLAVLNASSNHDKPIPSKSSANQAKPAKTKLITTPVRSGQQVVSHGDLIVTAAVSHGAELLADGHIHVYGALRGRALAGIDGNPNRRIFCQTLDAELVSIAGYYRLSDTMTRLTGPCQIYLQDEHIQIEPL